MTSPARMVFTRMVKGPWDGFRRFMERKPPKIPLVIIIIVFLMGAVGPEVARAVGEGGLNVNRDGAPCAPSIADPLPVADLLDAQYNAV